MSSVERPWLTPYVVATEKYGAGFNSLLWASPRTQRARFDAIRELCDPQGRHILDAGCGRADYLAYLIELGVWPASYVGIEAVDALADMAEGHRFPNTTILRADFVRDPARLVVGAGIVVFSGSLNTLTDAQFHETIRRAYDAAGVAVVFNFLSSTYLAGKEYLYWRKIEEVRRYCQKFCPDVRFKDDYLKGDCTACLLKPAPGGHGEAGHA